MSRKNEFEYDSKGEQTSDQNSSENLKDERREELAKRQILEASLPLVHEHGWTWRTIAAGAESVGYSGVAHGMFPRGGVELIHHFNVDCNRRLVAELQSQTKESKQRLMQNVQTSLAIRLRMIIPYIGTWPKAMATLSLPSNIPQSTKNLAVLIDDIWYYSGDRTANFEWYMKRLALASVYFATELALVQDKSDDFVETFGDGTTMSDCFLTRRLHELDQFQKFTNGIPSFVNGLATTFQNMLGLGGVRR